MGSEKLVEFLLSNGADINVHNQYGDTPLHIACTCVNNDEKAKGGVFKKCSLEPGNGNEELVKIFLNKGADIATVNNQGQTPFHVACERGNKTIVELFLKKGAAGIQTKDKHGRLPVDCIEENNKELISLVKKYCVEKSDISKKNIHTGEK